MGVKTDSILKGGVRVVGGTDKVGTETMGRERERERRRKRGERDRERYHTYGEFIFFLNCPIQTYTQQKWYGKGSLYSSVLHILGLMPAR